MAVGSQASGFPSWGWTQSSLITGIKKEQKLEIVSTLVSYPLVLEELYLTQDLLESCKKINLLYEQRLFNKDFQIENLNNQINAYEAQTKLFSRQLKKQRFKTFGVVGLGVLVVVGVIILN